MALPFEARPEPGTRAAQASVVLRPWLSSAARAAIECPAACGCAFFVIACAKLPAGKSAVSAVEIEGADAVDADDIKKRIATSPSPRFLGLWSGVFFDYEVF